MNLSAEHQFFDIDNKHRLVHMVRVYNAWLNQLQMIRQKVKTLVHEMDSDEIKQEIYYFLTYEKHQFLIENMLSSEEKEQDTYLTQSRENLKNQKKSVLSEIALEEAKLWKFLSPSDHCYLAIKLSIQNQAFYQWWKTLYLKNYESGMGLVYDQVDPREMDEEDIQIRNQLSEVCGLLGWILSLSLSTYTGHIQHSLNMLSRSLLFNLMGPFLRVNNKVDDFLQKILPTLLGLLKSSLPKAFQATVDQFSSILRSDEIGFLEKKQILLFLLSLSFALVIEGGLLGYDCLNVGISYLLANLMSYVFKTMSAKSLAFLNFSESTQSFFSSLAGMGGYVLGRSWGFHYTNVFFQSESESERNLILREWRLDETASNSEIRAAYRNFAKLIHPDQCVGCNSEDMIYLNQQLNALI